MFGASRVRFGLAIGEVRSALIEVGKCRIALLALLPQFFPCGIQLGGFSLPPRLVFLLQLLPGLPFAFELGIVLLDLALRLALRLFQLGPLALPVAALLGQPSPQLGQLPMAVVQLFALAVES